jgi:hypothetical protein
MSRSQKIGQRRDIKKEKRFFEDVAEFKYLGATLQIKIACTKRLRAD